MDNFVYQVSRLGNDEYRSFLFEQLIPMVETSVKSGEDWFVFYDINSSLSKRGIDFILHTLPEVMAVEKTLQVTVLLKCNRDEVSENTLSFIKGNSDGIIKTWADGSYQFLQIVKTPGHQISPPLIVENIEKAPYIRLV